MKRKISVLLVAMIILSAFMSACGGGSSSSAASTASSSAPASSAASSAAPASSSAPAEAAPVEIRAAWWGDTGRHELYNKIVDEFQAAYPNVTVVREPTSWNDYWDKLSVQSAGGNAPDFIGMHAAQYGADYVSRGVVEPLDGYIADGIINLDNWAEGVIATGVFGGVNYMIPMGVTFSCSFVNTGVFKELGIDPPGFDWSWDDMKTIGLQVREALDAQGKTSSWLATDDSTNINSMRYFIRQLGHELYDAEGNIDMTPEDVEAWLAMYKEFRDLGIIPDAATGVEYTNATLEDNLFSKDKVLIARVPVNQYKLYRTTFPDKEISIIRNQTYTGKAVGEFPEGAHFAVYAKSTDEKKLAAAQLLNFWVNDERGLVLFGLDQGVPGNQVLVNEAVLPTLDEYQLEIVDFANKLMEIATPTIYPPPGASEIDAVFKTMAENVAFDAMTPADAAREFHTQAVAIRSKN